MSAIPTAIPDVLLLEPKVFGDARGFFFESYNRREFREATGIDAEFVQDNHSRIARRTCCAACTTRSRSRRASWCAWSRARSSTWRWTCAARSPTFGQWVGGDALGREQAHALGAGRVRPRLSRAVRAIAEFLYKTTDYYAPEHERSLLWNDRALAIAWPLAGRSRWSSRRTLPARRSPRPTVSTEPGLRILLVGIRRTARRDAEARPSRPWETWPSFDHAALDLADAEALARVCRDVAPEVIVNAAAYTAVDKAESEPALAHAVNARAPGILAGEARRLGALLVHYSTDYVFDGAKRTPYVETDPVAPLGVYGASKLAGEQAIAASGCAHLVLRTGWVYAPHGSNFLVTMLRLAETKRRTAGGG